MARLKLREVLLPRLVKPEDDHHPPVPLHGVMTLEVDLLPRQYLQVALMVMLPARLVPLAAFIHVP